MFAEIYKNRDIALPFVLTTLGESVKQLPVHRPEGFGYHQFIWVKEGSGRFDIPGRIGKVRMDGTDAYADMSVFYEDCKDRSFFLYEKE